MDADYLITLFADGCWSYPVQGSAVQVVEAVS